MCRLFLTCLPYQAYRLGRLCPLYPTYRPGRGSFRRRLRGAWEGCDRCRLSPEGLSLRAREATGHLEKVCRSPGP